MKIHLVPLFLLLLAATTGCTGPRVEVPPAHRGKVLTSSGYTGGLRNPSSFTLPYSYYTKPMLVLAEVSDVGKEEELEVWMPKDKLKLKFDVRGTFAIAADEERIESIFDRVTPEDGEPNDHILKISFEKVYATYAQQAVRRISREILMQYSIEQVLANIEKVSSEVESRVRQELKNTPITCIQLGIASIEPPSVVIVAQEQAKKREIEIQRAEADKLVKLKEAEAALAVAKKQQEVDLLEAETQVLVDKKLAEGVTEAFVLQRSLKALDKLVERDNVFVLPMEALRHPSLLMGISDEALQELRHKRGKK